MKLQTLKIKSLKKKKKEGYLLEEFPYKDGRLNINIGFIPPWNCTKMKIKDFTFHSFLKYNL